ncbi:MAG: hypothetical protein PHW53_04765 [Patescibacteria group bacterium]|nr:hypothetical protein [Patescibacteria group bacterium]
MRIPQTITIDGEARLSHSFSLYLIRIDGRPIWLQGRMFYYFLRLVWGWHKFGAEGIHILDIEPGYNQHRYVYRLRQAIARIYPGWPIVSNNQKKRYTLIVNGKTIFAYNYDNLTGFDDTRIRRMVEDLRLAGRNDLCGNPSPIK